MFQLEKPRNTNVVLKAQRTDVNTIQILKALKTDLQIQ